MNARIAQQAPEHAAALHELLMRIATESLSFPADALARYRQDWSVQAIENGCKNQNRVFLGAWVAEKPVGLLLGTPPEGGVATIVWLLVDAAHASHGIGAKLFAEGARRYREIGAHKVKLTAPSQRARDFYVAQGMEVEGFHRDHWWHQDFWALGMRL